MANNELIRLQKFFTDCGIMSRRAAEAEIAAGKVKVNGQTAEIGMKINPKKDHVIYMGKRIQPKAKSNFVYIMLNKPRGYITSTKDPQGRKCVTDLLEGVTERVYPIGRLDLTSEGILLLTNDGVLANRLTHPKHAIPKIYRVKVDKQITEHQLETLRSELVIDDYKIQPVDVEVTEVDESGSVLKMTLFEGRNRQIRKMCEIADLKVKRLNRVAIGALKLNNLGIGKWRYLEQNEVEYLYSSSK
jgi:23S rRNA pseudouridine2605 synthase